MLNAHFDGVHAQITRVSASSLYALLVNMLLCCGCVAVRKRTHTHILYIQFERNHVLEIDATACGARNVVFALTVIRLLVLSGKKNTARQVVITVSAAQQRRRVEPVHMCDIPQLRGHVVTAALHRTLSDARNAEPVHYRWASSIKPTLLNILKLVSLINTQQSSSR